MKNFLIFLLFILLFPYLIYAWSMQDLKLPPGFKIQQYAKVPLARQLVQLSSEVVVVGTENGKVYALLDQDKNFKIDQVLLLADKFNIAAGVAYQKPHLYISDKNRIYRFTNILENLSHPKIEVVTQELPSSSYHAKRYIKFSPSGELFISVGAPCNVCLKQNSYYGTIMKFNLQTSKLEIFSKGVRNSVGFDWHPVTQELWFTDNGRDWLGDDSPADELNLAHKKGLHFGFPYLHGKDVVDAKFGSQSGKRIFEKPVQELGNHNAALGMIFYTGKMFPKKYYHNIFIAEHGSWNRSKKSGYRLAFVNLHKNRAVSYESFISGWEVNEKVYGRPVDLLMLGDGSLLVSDDDFGLIYRITYDEN